MTPRYLAQPDDVTCGQTCIAMLTGQSVAEVCEGIGNRGRAHLMEMQLCLRVAGYCYGEEGPLDLAAPLALLHLEGPLGGHWALLADGLVYDPMSGVLPVERARAGLG